MIKLRQLKNLDWILILCLLALFVLGCIVIYSTTINSLGFGITLSQIIFGVIGFILLFFFALFDYRGIKTYSRFLYVTIIVLLLYVLFAGRMIQGASRWIDFGFFQFQPSELAKLVVIIILAKYFAKKGKEMKFFSSFLVSFLYILLPLILIIAQPDLGTALVLIVIWGGMLFATQAKKIYFLGLSFLTFSAVPIIYKFFLKDYQRQRILTFLNPSLDPQGSGYNVLQSTISVGSGQMFGRGLGHGPQSQLKFLPERFTDFIFSVFAEELGFVGAIILLTLFFIVIIRLVRAAKISSDSFGGFFAIGVAIWVLFQVFINIGMNIGIAPVTGIPLPLISAGGSSVIVFLISFGIVQSIIFRHKRLSFGG